MIFDPCGAEYSLTTAHPIDTSSLRDFKQNDNGENVYEKP